MDFKKQLTEELMEEIAKPKVDGVEVRKEYELDTVGYTQQ